MEEALIAHLLASTSLAALVGTRVYPASRPQETALPAVVVSKIDGAPLYADDGEVGLDQARVQIDCLAEHYADAKGVARAVRVRLSDFSGTVDGVTFEGVFQEDEQDGRESGSNMPEYPYRVKLEFTVWTRSTGA